MGTILKEPAAGVPATTVPLVNVPAIRKSAAIELLTTESATDEHMHQLLH